LADPATGMAVIAVIAVGGMISTNRQ